MVLILVRLVQINRQIVYSVTLSLSRVLRLAIRIMSISVKEGGGTRNKIECGIQATQDPRSDI
jgi:hypothetical protein